MAQSSDYYQQQLEDMGDMPDFKSVIADAYNQPIIQPIVGEGQRLAEQFLPSMFDTFVQTGTGAGDMSPAAKLAHIGRNLNRLTAQMGANRDVQSFYNTQIQDLANIEYAKWQDRQNRLKDLYSMAYQKEEAARTAAAQADQMNAINALIAEQQRLQAEAEAAAEDQARKDIMADTAVNMGHDLSTLEGLNKYRAVKGLPAFTAEEYANYYPNYALGSSRNMQPGVGWIYDAVQNLQKPDLGSRFLGFGQMIPGMVSAGWYNLFPRRS